MEPLPRAHVHKAIARLKRAGREGLAQAPALGTLALFEVLANINKVGESG